MKKGDGKGCRRCRALLGKSSSLLERKNIVASK
jgi:hypothetical protein